MYLSDRKNKIISELLHDNSCITGQYLANVAGVTSRTIRADVSELNKELAENDIKILSITGKGYFIPKENKKKARELINIEQQYRVPVLPENRVEHIIRELLINPGGVSKEKISTQLYVSKSTLDRDFLKVEKKLNIKEIYLQKKTDDIFCIRGDECAAREMYIDFFSNTAKSYYFGDNTFSDEIKNGLEKAKRSVQEAIEKHGIKLSGDQFYTVCVFLAIALFRISKGYIVDKFDKNTVSDDFIKEIVNLAEYETEINEAERKYLNHHLSKIIHGEMYGEETGEIEETLEKGIEDVSLTFEYDFSSELKDRLTSTLTKNVKINSSEYFLEDIKREYPMAFEMSVSLANFMDSEINFGIDENVLTEIALIFSYEMEKSALREERKKRNIIVICQSGKTARELIEVKIKRYFPEFDILGFFPPYDVEKGIQKKPDIILSTMMTESDDIPIVIINPLFKDYDVLKVNTVIRQLEHSESIGYEFINLFKEELFIKDMEAFDKYDAIKKLYDKMLHSGYANDGYFQAVLDREKISATALGNMVAVPHAINANIGENIAAIGILKKPIEWNGEKVQIVFLINIGNTKDNNVKQIFRSFFDVISAAGKVDRLIKSRNYYEFIKRINQ